MDIRQFPQRQYPGLFHEGQSGIFSHDVLNRVGPPIAPAKLPGRALGIAFPCELAGKERRKDQSQRTTIHSNTYYRFQIFVDLLSPCGSAFGS